MTRDNLRLLTKPAICKTSDLKMPSLTCEAKNEAALQGVVNVIFIIL